MSRLVTEELMKGFLEAFNRHDLDTIMGYFAEDCVSEWKLTGTSVTGKKSEVRGVDLLEFAEGKITRKDSFWKILE